MRNTTTDDAAANRAAARDAANAGGATAGTITIGTRGSGLARWQADHVADAIRRAFPEMQVNIRVITTKGDRILDVPLAKIGDKGLFTKELEAALLAGEVDMCVHSMKDMPGVLPEGCMLGAMLPRADARDALVCGPNLPHAHKLADVACGARIGTGSLRRTAQLRARYPHIEPCEIRGNVDTRLAKAESGAYDGVILAVAGISRMGLSDRIACAIDVADMVPAVGQGAIGVEVRQGDERAQSLCRAIACTETEACVMAERHILRELEGGCQVPIGAFARREGDTCILDAVVLSLDGTRQARAHKEASLADTPRRQRSPEASAQHGEASESDLADVFMSLAERALATLREQEAEKILEEIRGTDAREAAAQSPRTCVYLVGAGPGDMGLMTVKGLSLVQRADIIVYDYLANPALLVHARPDAELIDVGKKGFSTHIGQEAINALLVRKARELEKRTVDEPRADASGAPRTGEASAPRTGASDEPVLVRLKGGDPFVFGRGGEEALALAEAGIPFEVVPGVTSGVAAPAYAGIPVTHRMVASSVTFVTGNEDPTKEETALDWDALARMGKTGGTLCFYMGVRNLEAIARNLIAHGLLEDTPTALVRWGTTAKQQVLFAPLADAAARAAAANFTAPAIIVVGPVAAMRDKLRWFARAPLAGKRIVVTRARAQASALSDELAALGAEVFEMPAIEIGAPDSYDALDAALSCLETYDWLVFTSANGVERFFARLAEGACFPECARDARALAHARIAAIGPATASQLAAHGIVPDVVPSEYRAEAVFEALVENGLTAEKRVLIPRAQEAREALPRLLASFGAQVDVVPVYRTELPASSSADRTRSLFASGNVDAVTFTSSSTVRNLLTLLGAEAHELLRSIDLFSIGPVTTGTLAEHGFSGANVREAPAYTIPHLVALIRDTYDAEGESKTGKDAS